MPALPDKMRCVEIAKPGGPDAMAIGHRPLPQPNAGEVLIEVHATSVNRLDVFQREGVYPIPPGASDILGLDVAGIIAGLGAGVTGWAIGDKVCALLTGGWLCGILHQLHRNLPADPRRPWHGRSGDLAGNHVHRLVEHFRPVSFAAR